MTKISLNGKEFELTAGKNITDLLTQLNLTSSSLAVAVNDEVVIHKRHDDYELNDGDRVDIVKAIGGG